MQEVTLTIYTPEGTTSVPVSGDRLLIGRTDAAGLCLEDPGLSRLHASINRDGERVWLLDEGSTNGTYVNGVAVPAVGKPLTDGDKINMGDYTTIWVSMRGGTAVVKKVEVASRVSLMSRLKLVASIVLVFGLVVALGWAVVKFPVMGSGGGAAVNKNVIVSNGNSVVNRNEDHSTANSANENSRQKPNPQPVLTRKLYKDMSQEEKKAYVEQEARRVSLMMGNRECQFTDQVKAMIKVYVDGYARRVGNRSGATWGEDFNGVFKRATRYAPLIIHSFRQEGVQPAVGLYVAMIESEYGLHCYDNFAGAMGMFQFLAGTARGYGLQPSDRCDPQKMAPAAAKYMKDRIAGFGIDATSVALAIAGYNRSPASVLRDLHDVINSENPERSFWNLVANSGQLDHYFQENMKYVPKFFAAAIVCENPEVFGLSFHPLSTYEREIDQPQ